MKEIWTRIRKKPYKSMIAGILFVAWTGFIFSASMQTGVQSAERSRYFVQLFNNRVPEIFIRKSAHVLEYIIEGIILALGAKIVINSIRMRFYASVVAGVIIANIDEIIQIFSVGRSASIIDVGIDTAGVIIGAGLMLIFTKKGE